MTDHQTQGQVREAVGIFADESHLQAAIDDLLSHGFNQAELSLLAAEKAVEDKLGHKYKRVETLEDNATVPTECFVSTEARGDAEGALIGGLIYVGAFAALGAVVASGGSLAAAIVGAAVAGGSGGIIGGVLASLMDERHAKHLQEQLDHGGLLLWVRTRDQDHELKAIKILKKHSGHDVHVHGLPDKS